MFGHLRSGAPSRHGRHVMPHPILMLVASTVITSELGAQAIPTQAATPGIEQQGKARLTVEHVLDAARTDVSVRSLAWFPGSASLLLEIGNPTGDSWLEVVDVATSTRRILSRGYSPVLSPDGTRIAFLSDSAHRQYLVVASTGPLATRGLRRIAGTARSRWPSRCLSWSPDGTHLAYCVRSEEQSATHRSIASTRSNATAQVVGTASAGSSSHLYLLNTVDMTRRLLTNSLVGEISNPSWAGEHHLLFTLARERHGRLGQTITGEIRSFDLETKEVRTIVAPGGLQQRLKATVSPDGGSVVFQYHADSDLFDFTTSIGISQVSGGNLSRMTDPGLSVMTVVGWDPSGRTVYFLRQYSTYRQIYSVDRDRLLRPVTHGARDVLLAAVSPDGRSLAWWSRDIRGGSDLRVGGVDGRIQRSIVDFSPNTAEFLTGAVDELRWRSRDGLEIAGFLIKPVGYEPGVAYPLLVDVHGGGYGSWISLAGSILQSTTLEWHLWATLGYAVFVPDYRTSGSFGWQPVVEARNADRLNERDLDDIMTGVESLVRSGIADSNRLALLGVSAGAYRTNWAITQTHKFRAAVSYEGWAEDYLSYAIGGSANEIEEWLHGGTPWGATQAYLRASPLFHVRRVTTPTLFIRGDECIAGAAPYYSIDFMYAALKRQGVDTRLVQYRGEGHTVRQPANQRHLLGLVMEWIDAHLRATADTPGWQGTHGGGHGGG